MNNSDNLTSTGHNSSKPVLYFIILCLLVFPIFGALYAFIIRGIAVYFFTGVVIVIPWIAAFFGYCVGYIVYVSVFRNNSFYNPKQQFFMVLTVLIIAYYFHWIFWVATVIDSSESLLSQVFILITEPKVLFDSIVEIKTSGTWHIDDDEELHLGATKGIILSIFWFCELLLMTLYPFFVAENYEQQKQH